MLIEHIDAIARKKQRDVLLVRFSSTEVGEEGDDFLFEPSFDWQNAPARQQIIDWLDANAIAWQACGDVANPECMVSYRGQIYIDIPYDEALPAYQALEAFLENPDGSMRIPGTAFWLLSLDLAMKNVEHDEPGYWKRWAENF
jgi:hypothetical protein